MSVSRIDKLIFEVSGKKTIAEAAARRSKPLQIVTPTLKSAKHVTMVRMAVDLGLRVFNGDIYVIPGDEAPDTAKLLGGLGTEYDGRARVCFKTGAPNLELPIIRIADADGPGHIADASGWNAYIGRTAPDNTWASVPACAFAVSCAFADLVKSSMLGQSTTLKPWLFNLLTLKSEHGSQTVPEYLDLGYLAMLGAGAIGTSLAYLMIQTNLKAKIDVIDSQRYEEPNHETSLLISHEVAISSPKKADHLARLLSEGGNVIAKAFTDRVDSASEILKVKRDVFICGVDNSETRQCLDSVNAPLLLNAGLGGTKLNAGHVLYTEHSARDAKLSTTYRSSSQSLSAPADSRLPEEFKDLCSRLNYESASLAAPFLALASASLLLSGIVRRATATIGSVSYLKLDLLGNQKSFLIKERFSEPASTTTGLSTHPYDEIAPLTL